MAGDDGLGDGRAALLPLGHGGVGDDGGGGDEGEAEEGDCFYRDVDVEAAGNGHSRVAFAYVLFCSGAGDGSLSSLAGGEGPDGDN